MTIKALLFDLDGTLLPIDTERFIRTYMYEISTYIAPYADPEQFIKQIWASTDVMMRNLDANLTNQQVFEADFYDKVGKKEELIPLLDRFYEEEFPKLADIVSSHGFIGEMVQTAKEQGYRLILATNPLFPRSAILQRLRWAGANPDDFEWITSYENAHYTKPNPLYFQEIIERIGLPADECLMVGNDAQEDLVAQQVGLRTYLVTDHLIDRGEPPFTPDGRGTMREFYEELRDKKGIFAK